MDTKIIYAKDFRDYAIGLANISGNDLIDGVRSALGKLQAITGALDFNVDKTLNSLPGTHPYTAQFGDIFVRKENVWVPLAGSCNTEDCSVKCLLQTFLALAKDLNEAKANGASGPEPNLIVGTPEAPRARFFVAKGNTPEP